MRKLESKIASQQMKEKEKKRVESILNLVE